jgi:rod shape-determining protein MreB
MMLEKHLTKAIYVKVYENRYVLKLLEEGELPISIVASEPFTTTRLLVGQFMAAECALKKGFKDVLSRKWFSPSLSVVIHPLEKVEGGLSEVEERVFKELALSAGARRAKVWVGHELSDAEALLRANST